MVLSVIAMSGLVIAPKANASASAGDLIKMAGLSSVYYLGSDGKRYVFPNSTTYFSWYPDFSGVITIPASELQSYPLGGNVTMRAGTNLVKVTTDPSVYAVTPNGVLRKIQSEADASALYGANWNKRVVDVPDAFFTNYTIGTPLASGEVPAGSLVKNANSSSVYYYDGTNYRLIPDEAAFNSNRFKWNEILTLSSAITAGGSNVTSGEFANTAQNGSSNNVVTGSGLMVSLNANTAPAATIISAATGSIGQSIAPLASFNFTAANDGAVTVKSVRLHRIGVSSDTSLANVYLYQGNTKLTDAGTFSNGYVTFSNASGIFTVPAGQSVTITVKADVAAGISGGTVGAEVQAASDVTATASTVSGSFPLDGNLMSVTQVSDLATVKASTVTPSNAGNVNAGTLQQTLWSSQLTVGQKAVKLSYVAFRQIGSVAADAIQNLGLFVNGNKVASATSVGSDGYVRFDLSASPITLNTGASTVELRGDIMKGSNYNYIFSVQTAADMVLTDTNYGVNVAITAQTGNLPLSAAQTTISAGSVSTQVDPAFTATQFVANQAQTVLGQWKMTAYGEDEKVQQLVAKIAITKTATTTAGSAEGFNNLTLYVNGGSVGATQNSTKVLDHTGATSDSLADVTFGSTNLFTIPAGTTVTVTLKGDSVLNTPTTVTAVAASLYANASAFEGLTSFTYSSAAANNTAGTVGLSKSLSAGSANATVSANGGYTNQTLSYNTTKQKIGSYMIQASSADGVQVTSLTVGVPAQVITDHDISNLYVVTPDMPNGATPVNPASTNNFTTNFTVAANQTAQVDVYADLIATSSAVTSGFNTTLTGNGLGTTSHQAVTLSSANGQTITVGTGALSSVTLSNSSPVAQIMVGGTNGAAIATYNFVASTSGGVNVTELGFTFATSSAASTAVSSVTVGGQTAAVVSGKALVTGLNLNVPASYGGLDVPVTVNLAPVGLNGVADQTFTMSLAHVKYLSGNATVVDDAASAPSGITGFGGGKADSLTSAFTSTGVAAKTMQLAGVAPVVSLVASTGNLTTGVVKVGSVKVVAPTGNMTMKNLTISLGASGATIASNTAIVVKDASNNTTITTTGSTTASGTGTSTIAFTGGYTIASGSTGTTFDVYVNVASIPGASGTGRVTLGLDSDLTNFTWTDVNGNVDLNGTYILNFPNTTVSIVN